MTTEQKLVLVADDSAANRLTLRLELVDQGLAVEEAADGAQAIELLRTKKFAAVITDVWMPEADGIAVIHAIRGLDAEVPVFVITGGGPGLSIASAAALAEVWGARKVYVKPFDVRDLVGEIKTMLG